MDSEPPGRQVEQRVPLHRNLYLWGFIIGCVVITAMRPLLRHVPAPPPVLGHVPPYTLTDSSGRPFGSVDLAGHAYVASFFFTSCPSICPALMRAVARLQDRYKAEMVEGVRLVSISVDPAHDTPARLQAYAAGIGADPKRWTLLTGSPEQIRAVVVDGFKTAMSEPGTQTPDLIDITHSGKLVLVDAEGGLRGYYDSDEMGLDEVFHRSQHVLHEHDR